MKLGKYQNKPASSGANREAKMITTHKQALAVQERRVKAGKRGFAKAVRRYFNQHSKTFKRPTYFANGLPVIWAKPAKAA